MKERATFWPSMIVSLLALAAVAYFSAVTGPQSSDPEFSLYQIRLPRFLTAAILGAGLAIAGQMLQLATKNPLSDPEILGINQGAVFSVVALLLVSGNNQNPKLLLLAALVGGGVTGTAILLMASSGAFPRERLILAGLTLAFFFGSASGSALIMKETDLFELLHWTAGKLSGAQWSDAGLATLALVVAVILAIFRASQWNALLLGEESAKALGVDPVGRRVEIIACTVLLCAVCVAVAGPIGFVGIIVPHLSRILAGLDYRRSVPLTIILGALLVSASDLVARTVIHPAEIPVGILTALVGAPYFLYRARQL